MANKWKWRGGKESETRAPSVASSASTEIYPPGTKLPLHSNSNISAPEFVQKAREQMGMMARWKFDKDTQKELQRVAGSIAVNYLTAQKDIMLANIEAGVGIAKREIFRDFLTKAIEQDRDLVERTNGAQKDIVDMIVREVLVVLEEKKVRYDEAKAKFDGGKLLEKDYTALCDAYDHAAEELINDKFARMDKIAQTYLEHFEHAIKIYREKVIQMGGVIS
ncbi:MAG: hypothetical protein ABSD08_08165 [Xanthobacteraceae bacterium]